VACGRTVAGRENWGLRSSLEKVKVQKKRNPHKGKGRGENKKKGIRKQENSAGGGALRNQAVKKSVGSKMRQTKLKERG